MKLNIWSVKDLSYPVCNSKFIFEVAGFGKNFIIFAVPSGVIPGLFWAIEVKVNPNNKINIDIILFNTVKVVNSFKKFVAFFLTKK